MDSIFENFDFGQGTIDYEPAEFSGIQEDTFMPLYSGSGPLVASPGFGLLGNMEQPATNTVFDHGFPTRSDYVTGMGITQQPILNPTDSHFVGDHSWMGAGLAFPGVMQQPIVDPRSLAFDTTQTMAVPDVAPCERDQHGYAALPGFGPLEGGDLMGRRAKFHTSRSLATLNAHSVTGNDSGQSRSVPENNDPSATASLGATLPPGMTGSSELGLFTCLWPGCTSTRTFGRIYELHRHMNKHTRKVKFDCPVLYCPRKGERSFYRPDRLGSHLEIGHSQDESCRCPKDGCCSIDLSIKSLRFHIFYAHDYRFSFQLEDPCPRSRAGRRQFHDFLHVRCELKKCKRRLYRTADSLQKHLGDHERRDRDSQRDVIRRMGFDPDTLHVICPICKVHVPSRGDFLDHLEECHLTTDLKHWKAFKPTITEYWNEVIFRSSYKYRYSSKHASWSALPVSAMPSGAACAYCGAHPSDTPGGDIDHHLSLLITSGDIMRYREAIARLIPEFLYHPVFADIHPVDTASPEETPAAATL